MVQIRKGAIIRKIKDITIGGSLSLALLGTMSTMQSCGNNEQTYETVYTKGVQTFITEEEKGVFKITDEKVVEPEQSKAFVQYLDGRTETLTLEEAKKIAATADTTQWSGPNDTNQETSVNNNGHHSYGLSNVLMYGMMGYMLGRGTGFSPNANYYSSRETFNRSQQSAPLVQNSRISRPVNSSKGFFRSTGRSGGFGG